MLKSVEEVDVNNAIVALRADLDVEFENGELQDDTRLQTVLPTLEFLLQGDVKRVVVLGHMGRPGGEVSEKFSLKHLLPYFNARLDQEVHFVPHEMMDKFSHGQYFDDSVRLVLVENLRFWTGEKENSTEFAKLIAPEANMYVNEAFSVSHREHASVSALPKLIKGTGGQLAGGIHFRKEIEHLSKARENPKRPVVVVMGGAKEDKTVYIDKFKTFADKVLVGGRLPLFLSEDLDDPKILVARLNPDKCDITINSAEKFTEEIMRAGTIIVNGPMGKYEEEGQLLGTQKVFEAVANSNAFKVGGGGDTEHALETLGLKDKMDWVSVGGGASLDFLADGTLPGIEALTV